jgi:hypothetical protein
MNCPYIHFHQMSIEAEPHIFHYLSETGNEKNEKIDREEMIYSPKLIAGFL